LIEIAPPRQLRRSVAFKVDETMVEQSDSKLERMDPESEECFAALTDRIAWELSARIAMGDDPSTVQGCNQLSKLIADSVLDGFVVRIRTEPRYRWVAQE
jgi:hypothetical protein